MTTKNAMMKQTDETLDAIFSKIGEKYNYKEVEADFTAFKDFKVKWVRSYNWIRFDVSDYLRDAPDEVLEGVADTIFGRITGESPSYPECVSTWLSSPDFVKNHQAIYCNRLRGLKDAEGEVFDLRDSLSRLVDMGLLPSEEYTQIRIGWGVPGRFIPAMSSTLMKTIMVNECFDDPDKVDEETLDYIVYREVCHILLGFDPASTSRHDLWAELVSKFPASGSHEEYVSEDLNMRL